MNKPLYYEDFEVGRQFISKDNYTITRDEAVAFAKQYDPQAQHIDDEGAKSTQFGKIIVSGWQTAAVSMRLKTQTELFDVSGGLLGIGIEHLRWPRPTYPGDSLRVVTTILEKRLSSSRPDKGIVTYKAETFNQRDELVMEMIISVIVPRLNQGMGT